ncbi:DHHC family palmitoyltransferase [Skeletonema marinoi]|uniref:Palmitoyltransferase n=1 Tax=Skeletonema marinoi TaxID=267567 RepID=A0AAD8XSK3_9STRA|nr:DHHC family palmitoyltransferase [Skeletonema marinoi]
MMQRKNKVKPTSSTVISPVSSIDDDAISSSPSKPSSSSALLRKNSDQNPIDATSKNNSIHSPSSSKKKGAVVIATVKRNTWGTQPFDKHWLNLDCCGLICASMTYMLHAYGVYSFGWILLPPWFSVMDEDGYRELTFGCNFHRTLFITIAALAVFAHFKAMTTDPGAVPPDANPLPDLEELECLIKGEESPRVVQGAAKNRKTTGGGVGGGLNSNGGGNSNGSSLMMHDEMQQKQQSSLSQQHSLSSVSQATATVAIGAAAVVVGGVAGAVATVASSAAPQKPNNNMSSSSSPAPQSSSPNHVHGPNCNHNNSSSALPPRGRRMCRRCQAFKPPRAHHCSICNRCIIKMDHHCPWVNNCVGIGNHKYFLLFIFYTSLSCGYSLSFLVWRFCHCVGGGHGGAHHGPRCVDHPTDLLPLIGLTVEALLFGLFTMCMMCDQWDVVMTNLTHIDRLKGHDTLQHRVQAGINEVFGTGRSSMTSSSSSTLPHHHHHSNHHATNYRRGFHFTWLSPLHKVCFPESVRDDIFGYCRPVSGGGGGRRRQSNTGIEMSGLSGGGAEIV